MEMMQYLALLTLNGHIDKLRGETARPLGADRTGRSARRSRRRLGRRGETR
jgi:hypothetical protein